MTSKLRTTDTELDQYLKTVHVETTGTRGGPTAVILHGWGSSAELMRSVADAISDIVWVINVDLPGHGRSSPPPRAFEVADFANLVAAILDREGVSECTLIGHSNGGRIGLFMAADTNYSGYIRRLALISPSGIRPLPSAGTRLRALIARVLKAPFLLLPGSIRQRGLDWLRESTVWKALGSSDYRAAKGVMRDTFVRTVTTYLDDVVDHVTVPTLIFRGTADTAVTERQVRVLSERIPDSGVVTLEGAGHYGFLDRPDMFNAALRHFLTHP